ncbi:MAG: hypothetical protein WD077_00825 [Bacteroidia bacterium]
MSGSLWAQNIEWSEARRLNKNQIHTDIIGSDENGILLRRYNPRNEHKKVFLDFYSPDLDFEETRKIRFRKNQYFQKAFFLNRRTLLFYTAYKKEDQQLLLKVMTLNNELKEIKKEQTVLTIDTPDARRMPLAIRLSDNGDEFIIAYDPWEAMEREELLFFAADTGFSSIRGVPVNLPPNASSWLQEWLIAKDGIFAIVHSYPASDPDYRSKCTLYYQSLIDGTRQSYPLNDDTAYATQVLLAHDRVNNAVVFAGFFSSRTSMFDEGNLYGRLQLDNDSFFSRYEYFPQDLLDKALGKFSGDPGLLSFYLEDIALKSNGDAIISAEEVDVSRRSVDMVVSPVPRGYIRYYYYLNNIIALSISNTGRLRRYDVIKKEQVTLNDGAYYSSYQTVVLPEHIRFLFNDMTRKNPNLMSYRYDGSGTMDGELILSGNEYTGRLVIREARQVSANAMLIPGFHLRQGYTLVRLTW